MLSRNKVIENISWGFCRRHAKNLYTGPLSENRCTLGTVIKLVEHNAVLSNFMHIFFWDSSPLLTNNERRDKPVNGAWSTEPLMLASIYTFHSSKQDHSVTGSHHVLLVMKSFKVVRQYSSACTPHCDIGLTRLGCGGVGSGGLLKPTSIRSEDRQVMECSR